MISSLTAIRLLALVSVGVVYSLMPGKIAWESFVYSTAISHYLLSIYYSKKQISKVLSQPQSILPLFMVLGLGSWVIYTNFPLVIYFGIHHVFNEVYILKKEMPAEKHPWLRPLRLGGLLLHLSAYFFLVRNHQNLQGIDPSIFLAALIVSGIFFIGALLHARKILTVRQFIDHSLLEIIFLILCVASNFYVFQANQIVAYHFVFWFYYPVLKFLKVKSREEIVTDGGAINERFPCNFSGHQ